MNYPYENLDPERFQQFCQALLARDHPQLQCFPVAQPDGGRDAISYISKQQSSKFIVFQVKFARKPLTETDPHRWLEAIMAEEGPKIARLVPRGASEFYLLTNIDGTAHLDAGSIDRLNRLLSEQIQVPFMCWWRDDLNRRLDNAWDLKWAYPDLMTGSDFLRYILQAGILEERERRESTIRAFLTQQMKADELVRFRQVELQIGLLDLFVDVPIGIRDHRKEPRQARLFHGVAAGLISAGLGEVEISESMKRETEYDPRGFAHYGASVGAAVLLLSAEFPSRLPHVVLEGAPGQGKSTVVQYVCQVCRLKLLEQKDLLSKLPSKVTSVPSTRLPVKVDLRDLATWLGKQDPFDTSEGDRLPTGWKKTLEAFLAALISFQSGGMHFTTDDLVSVIRVSSVLIVFDGLDEIADISRRQEVVEEIVKGVQRLEANAASLQTIVTSRPAAFANSPGMPPDKYPYLQLLSLTSSLIDEYAERWLKVRNIEPREAVIFKKALKERLDQPHLRDLARNPMQLAILLSLILTRGTSLPDKRTALYDSYIDLFFSRESEKSPLVRQHRDLLVDIHRYLAWLLHSESERGNSRGSISQERLQQVLVKYLTREGQDPRLANQLFTGMVERVVALVSRVEGTFEFEVQPLREYFAARFLYDTAPYSPPGQEQRGTKPDRFDALVRNFYWTNVARFYAGCFSKGELPALAERLQELSAEEGFRYTAHPRILAATLLSDWVFMQNPKSVKQVVELLLDGIGLRYLLASGGQGTRHRGFWNPMILPARCGREEVVARCFDLLSNTPAPDYSDELVELAKANAENSELVELWCGKVNLGEVSCPSEWLQYAVDLGVLSRIENGRLRTILGILGVEVLPIALLFRAKRLDILEASEKLFAETVDGILERRVNAHPQRRVESALDALAHTVDVTRYAIAFSERVPLPLMDLIKRRTRPISLHWSRELATNTEAYPDHKKCMEFATISQDLCLRSSAEWATEIEPWDQLVEAGRALWGERWAFSYLANLACAIRSNAERCSEFPDLLDWSKSLCRRTRYARLRSGQKGWWRRQLQKAESAKDREFACLVVLTWARPSVLVDVQAEFDACVRALDGKSWHRVARAARRASNLAHLRREERESAIQVDRVATGNSPRTIAALMMRADPSAARGLYGAFLKDATITDEIILGQIQGEALDLEKLGTDAWNPDLAKVKQCYAAGTLEPHMPFARLRHEQYVIPLQVAEAIAREPNSFPSVLVALAEETWQRQVAGTAIAVAKVAEEQSWFGEAEQDKLFS